MRFIFKNMTLHPGYYPVSFFGILAGLCSTGSGFAEAEHEVFPAGDRMAEQESTKTILK